MRKRKRLDPASLDEIIDELTAEAGSDAEQIANFQEALRTHVLLPCAGFVIGEPVTVVAFHWDGNHRRLVTARCRRADGREYEVAASEVLVTEAAGGYRYLAAYRQWMGLEPYPPAERTTRLRLPFATWPSVDLSGPVELAVLSVTEKAARCRLLGSDDAVTLRAGHLWEVVPGEIAVVQPRKRWTYAGHLYLSGTIISARRDVAALGLVPLKLEERGLWDPSEEYWGEEGEPIDEWAKPIIARGRRPQFEMEQVLPGMDPDDADPDADPIGQAVDRKDTGDSTGAYKILMDLCQADLRCLDAHAHLGNMAFDGRPKDAVRHYEVGLRIGELSLGKRFDGVLPWGWIDNRPFLRCMHGFGLCLWRLGRFGEAAKVFDRMLWLNPSDNQGVRFLIDEVRRRVAWKDRQED